MKLTTSDSFRLNSADWHCIGTEQARTTETNRDKEREKEKGRGAKFLRITSGCFDTSV